MKRYIAGGAAALLALASCGPETTAHPAASAETPAVVSEAKPPPKPTISATVVDASRIGLFMVVPDKGDAGKALADGSAFEIRSNSAERLAVGDGDGSLVRVPAETAAQISGRKVKVTVNMRAAAVNGSPVVRIMYFRPGAESGSGWQEFKTTAEFAPVEFEYDVPAAASTAGFDNIGFWSDPEGKGRGVDIASVAVLTID